MKSKYEKLIEHIINEDHDKASEIFHKIIIEKSREIYESLMDDDHEGSGDKVDSLMHEISCDEEGMTEDDEEFGDEFGGEEGGDDEFGGEEGGLGGMGGDDMDADVDGEMGNDQDVEERVVDLEDALDELRAEFDRLMGGDEGGDDEGLGGEEGGLDDMGGDDMGSEGDEFGGSDEHGDEDQHFGESVGDDEDDDKDDEDEELDEDFAFMREYVEKVALPTNKNEGGEVGSKGSRVSVNTKSNVAGKNDMGGTTANIVKGGAEKAPDGTSPKTNAKKPGNLPNADQFANVPGADAGKKWWNKAKTPGNTEGKESGNGKTVSVNKNSEITGKGLNGNKSGKK